MGSHSQRSLKRRSTISKGEKLAENIPDEAIPSEIEYSYRFKYICQTLKKKTFIFEPLFEKKTFENLESLGIGNRFSAIFNNSEG